MSPVPLGTTVMSWFAPSSILIVPESVPLFVEIVKSPVPLVVIIASVLLSPTCIPLW